MHEVLRQRLMRRIESLPDEQVYQVLDFIEFLESKYAERHLAAESSGLQKFAENVEDRIRKKAMNPATLREAFQLIAAADRVLASVSSAGRQIVQDLGTLGEIEEGEAEGRRRPPPGPGRPGGRRSGAGSRPGGARGDGEAGDAGHGSESKSSGTREGGASDDRP